MGLLDGFYREKIDTVDAMNSPLQSLLAEQLAMDSSLSLGTHPLRQRLPYPSRSRIPEIPAYTPRQRVTPTAAT